MAWRSPSHFRQSSKCHLPGPMFDDGVMASHKSNLDIIDDRRKVTRHFGKSFIDTISGHELGANPIIIFPKAVMQERRLHWHYCLFLYSSVSMALQEAFVAHFPFSQRRSFIWAGREMDSCRKLHPFAPFPSLVFLTTRKKEKNQRAWRGPQPTRGELS